MMKETVKKLLYKWGIFHRVLAPYSRFAFWRDFGRKYNSFKGGDLKCNVCGSSYQKFVPFLPAPYDVDALQRHKVIGGYGNDVFCPNCMSNSRERLVIAMLQNQIDWKGKLILQMAPEAIIHKFLKREARVIATDFTPDRYRHIDKKIQFADITKLPFPDNHFDLVVANHIMEHIPDDLTAMKEVLRVLKKGGQAILQIPYSEILHDTIEDPYISDPKKQSGLFGQLDHVRIYSLKNYVQRLNSAGFDVVVVDSPGLKNYSDYTLQPQEVFFKIIKP